MRGRVRSGALALMLFGCFAAPASASRAYVAYAPAMGARGLIAGYELLPDGRLTPLPGSPFGAGGSGIPVGLAVRADGRFLATADQSGGSRGDSGVGVLALAADGRLAAAPGSPFAPAGSTMTAAFAPDVARVYVRGGGEDVYGYGQDAAGALVPLPGSPYASSGISRALAITPDGRFVFAGAGDAVQGFAIAGDGRLGALPGRLELGGEASVMVMSPDGRTLYAGTHNGRVVAAAVGPEGALTAVGAVTFPDAVVDLAVSPDGRWVHGGTYPHPGVRVWARAGSGALSELSGSPFATGMAAFSGSEFAPGGRHIVVSGTGTRVAALAVAADGALTLAPGSPTGEASNIQRLDPVAFVPAQAPVAAFTATPERAGAPTRFDGAGSSDPDGAVARYDWDFGDGTVLADGGVAPVHTYAQAGSYEVALTVSDAEGCSTSLLYTGRTPSCAGGPSARTTRTVTVEPPAPAPPPPTPPGECANGLDDDRDGFVDAADPRCARAGGVEGPADNPLLVCARRQLVLEDVVPLAGGRVRLAGVAGRELAGRRVELWGAGRRVVRATVAADGRFAATAPAPPRRLVRTIRYQARLGRLRSPEIKLTRAMLVRSAAVKRGRVVVSGRVLGARRGTVVELVGRRRGCTETLRLATARVRAGGAFTVAAAPFADVDAAVYRVRTRIGRKKTFTLFRFIRLR